MILIRHGQTIFNQIYGATRQDPGIPDPELTALGRQQVAEAADALRSAEVNRIVASPYTRALQTAEILADRLDVPVEVDVRVGERRAFVCDIGTPRSALSEAWSGISFDHIEEIWWREAEETPDEFHARCHRFAAAAAGFEDWHAVVVVTHWGVVRALTGQIVANAEHVRFDPTLGPAPAVVRPGDPW